MTVSQAIAKNHGGDIRFANKPSGGAVFTLSIPARTGTGPREEVDALLILADLSTRYPAEQALKMVGAKILSCTDISSALALAHRVEPRVIVVDASLLGSIEFGLLKAKWSRSITFSVCGTGEMEEPDVHEERFRVPLDCQRLCWKVKKHLNKEELECRHTASSLVR